MSTAKIEELIIDFSTDSFNPEKNFAVAVEYEKQNQIASAISFYLRTAEYGEGLLVYASLLKMAQCFDAQNDRAHTVTNCLMQAVTVLPYRPEAYFLLSQFHERQQNWQEAYTWACIGLSQDIPNDELDADVGYYGSYVLEFEKAVTGWWLNRAEESKDLFQKLLENKTVNKDYKNAIRNNLAIIWKETKAQ
jgi:tetratricopeptide (TPR) repeat protein